MLRVTRPRLRLTRSATSTPWVASALALAAAAAAGCGGGSAPQFDPIDDQIAQVGAEMSLEIRAIDGDGDDVSYDYAVNITDIGDRATLTKSPTGSAIFRWTPRALDVGQWNFDFTASDGDGSTTETVLIDVRSAIGAASAPQFRRPLGSGTTLDLEDNECLDVSVVIEDQDNAEVVIEQAEPLIEGATLEVTAGLTAEWHWCPDEAQSAEDERYTLTLTADDQANPKTIKDYLIVVRAPGREDCPGEAPLIDHTPVDEDSILSLVVAADIIDDVGLKQAPLFYYSRNNPGADPDLGAMTQTTMILIDGDMDAGTWAAEIPNPVADEPEGTSDDIFYVIVADDDDDDMGPCDHTTQEPSSGAFRMTVTSTGAGDAGLCNACTADVQCGDDGDLCVRVGAGGASYCLQACDGPEDCDAGFSCSPSDVTSVDGASERQCVPDTGSCDGGGVCVDDDYEQNDSRMQASANPPLPPDLYEFISCPAPGGSSDDEDWFKIEVPAEGQYQFEIVGDGSSDLDLALYRSNATKIAESTSLGDNEALVQCLDDLTYYIRVFNQTTTPNAYLLQWEDTGEFCSATCMDDEQENDDTPPTAREVTGNDFVSEGNAICPNDFDMYAVDVSAGDTIIVDLTFTQASSQEDLDVHLYNAGGTDLTPCPPCDTDNGQGVDSNEHFEFDVPGGCGASCTYYVSVQGYDDSANTYDIRIRK
jgi:hypothetical protein